MKKQNVRDGIKAFIAVVAVLAYVLTGYAAFKSIDSGSPESSESVQTSRENTDSSELHEVTEVVDGDTIKVYIDGKVETIRLIGIDTPEIRDPRKPVQCFGEEASNYAKSQLAGKRVKLQPDPTQDERDDYGRLLRYVLLEDGTNFNLQAISNGYAYEYTYQAPYQYQEQFVAAQQEAKDQNKGLWSPSTCDGRTEEGQALGRNSQPPDPDCPIKGNISIEDEDKVYHVPGQSRYSATVVNESNGERWFCSETEAQQAGWRKAKN